MNKVEVENIPMNLPSLCIPRVFKNISEARIRKVLSELRMGEIERIDIVSKTSEKGDTFNRIFVHFKTWFREGNAKIARERLLQGKEIKIIYDEPWFWKVSAYRNTHGNKPPAPKKKYIKPSFQFEDERKEVNIEAKNEVLVPVLKLEIPCSPMFTSDETRSLECSPPPLARPGLIPTTDTSNTDTSNTDTDSIYENLPPPVKRRALKPVPRSNTQKTIKVEVEA